MFLMLFGDFVVNELNMMFGFMLILMFLKCWVVLGLSYGDLIIEFVEVGL